MRTRRILVAVLVVLSSTAVACNRKAGSSSSSTTTAAGDLVAQVASYEVVAGTPQRVSFGIVKNGTHRLLSYGSVDVAFFYMGTKETPVQPPKPGPKTVAEFRPIPGQKIDPASKPPQLLDAGVAVGVYGTNPVTLEPAGFWGATISVPIGGKTMQASTILQVYDHPRLPFPGEDAPRTQNPTAGAPGVDPGAIESRAHGGVAIPDPELHSISVADAIAAGKPVLVVVSTPVYCVSQFCGPVTDSVSALAKQFGDRMAFVHLEVWKDFDNKVINSFAAEWIKPRDDPNADLQEPWVFAVGRDGKIVERWDDVATDAELQHAVETLIA